MKERTSKILLIFESLISNLVILKSKKLSQIHSNRFTKNKAFILLEPNINNRTLSKVTKPIWCGYLYK